jgi:hypothetical protein
MSNVAGRRALWLAVGAALVGGFALFVYGYATHVSPYYPRFSDQLSEYIGLYRTHYVLADPDLTLTARFDLAAPVLLDLRGWTVPWLATALGFVFGANRLAFASTNYLLFVAIVVALAAALARRCDAWTAGAGIGLLLTSRSIFLPAGGLQDLRMDLAGLAMFGIFVLALWRMAETPDRRHVALAALAYAASMWSRSVTGVYALGTIGAFGAAALAMALLRADPAWRQCWRAALGLGLIAAPIFALYVAIHYHAIDGYYFNLLRTDESRIRLAEQGLASRSELLGYYLGSGWAHFRPMVLWFAAALGLAVVAIIAGRLVGLPVRDARAEPPGLALAVTVVGAAIAGVLVPLSVFTPSPVVIGVLTVPLAALGAVVLAAAAARVPWSHARAAIALLPLAAGLWTCGRAFVAPTVWEASELPVAQAHTALFEQIAADHGGTIAWMTLRDGANWAGFSVYLYETGRAAEVPHFQHTESAIFAMDADAVRARIAAADGVVVWQRFPASPQYPAVASLRDTRDAWQPILDREFAMRGELTMADGTIAYYRRLAPRGQNGS